MSDTSYDEEAARVHCKAAKVCVESADTLLEDAGALHRAGEHGAAMVLHESITEMQERALSHLAAVSEQPDGEPPDGNDPEAKEARRLRAARAQAEARRLLGKP